MRRRNFSTTIIKARRDHAGQQFAVSCMSCGSSVTYPYRMSAKRRDSNHYCSAACQSAFAAKAASKRLAGRFWSRVSIGKPDDCWPWTGRRDPRGYGRFDYERKPQLAHRLVLVFSGKDVGDLCVCHRCDNPPCCNPAHLFLGTNADNAADMFAKGRNVPLIPRPGEANNTAKLTESQVLEILASKDRNADLARRYGVTKEAIGAIRRGINWSYLGRGAA